VFEGPRAFIDSLAACTGVRDDSGFIRGYSDYGSKYVCTWLISETHLLSRSTTHILSLFLKHVYCGMIMDSITQFKALSVDIYLVSLNWDLQSSSGIGASKRESEVANLDQWRHCQMLCPWS
jgi:hypothetical protein